MKLYHHVIACILLLNCISALSQTPEQLKAGGEYAFSIYQQLHRNPELGKNEFKTSALIKKELQQAGYNTFFDLPGLPTCIITVLDTKKEGPVIALRAELDARPGKETTGLPYASENDSVSHSCGHDAHASILLATAKLLQGQLKSLKGKIYFLFQPAEETKGGADDIVNSGILNRLGIQHIYALHSSSGMPVGTIGVNPGYIMAGSNYFSIELNGKSSHAATPYEGSNIPLLCSKLVNQLAEIPSVKMNISERPCVISTTYIETGKANALNVLPSTAILKGTIRAYEPVDSSYLGDPSIRALIKAELNQLCTLHQADYKLEINAGSPPTYNDNEVYSRLIPRLATRYSGTIDTRPYKGMFSEDFAFYTAGIPCLYFSLGISKDGLGNANVHSSGFSVHPDALKYGVELFCAIAAINL